MPAHTASKAGPNSPTHLEAIAHANSEVNHFEQAADAIVTGDTTRLTRLLKKHPDLPRARSTRRHNATLLHYVAANGIEDYRQKTPQNIVQITKLLLDSGAGADVNAIADLYGGSTTLSLTATSAHPERAGVQDALLQLLLDRGATLDEKSPSGGIVNACLANGRASAAEFLANRGAALDLEAAAGLGRLDIVKTFVDKSTAPESTVIDQKKLRGFLWACEYGRNEVVDFLLNQGIPVQTQAKTGQTALHWAIIGGHEDTVSLLLSTAPNSKPKTCTEEPALRPAGMVGQTRRPQNRRHRLRRRISGPSLKIWASNISLTLIESNHKKAAFLREVARALTLTDVNVQNACAETLAEPCST